MALALPLLSGIQPSPVAIPLHDERLSNPTTTDLRVISTQHKGFSSISAPMGLWEREMRLPHLSSPYHPDSTCEEKIKEKKETKPPTPVGKNV